MLEMTIKIPDLDREQLAAAAQHVLNAVAKINADWYLSQWEIRDRLKASGRADAASQHDPPCCAKCGGVRYVPERDLAHNVDTSTMPEVLRSGSASCQSIAAGHTGHKIAEAVYGGMPWEEACRRFVVAMAPGDMATRPRLLHAICLDDGKFVDATEGMIR